MLNLDNGVLLDVLDEEIIKHSSALINIAAGSTNLLGEEEEAEHDVEDDEDSLTHCAFFGTKNCEYQDTKFKPSSKTNWIGCSYPDCDRWYHEQCLKLKFCSEQARNANTLICPKHENVKKHFKDKIAPMASDHHSLFKARQSQKSPFPNATEQIYGLLQLRTQIRTRCTPIMSNMRASFLILPSFCPCSKGRCIAQWRLGWLVG